MEEERQTEVQRTTTQVDGTGVQRQTVSQTVTEVSGVVVAQRVIWFIVGIINVLLAIRFALLLLGANNDAGFVEFIYSLSNIFVAPFVGIFGTPVYGVSIFDISSLLAIAVYSLIAWGITKLLTLARPRQEV